MADQAQPTYRYSPAEPELKDVLDLWKKDVMLSTNCHAVATVKKFTANNSNFTPARPSIEAEINYSRTIFLPDTSGTPQPIQKSYPLLVDVPIIIMSGGAAALTFPIAVGDQVLILFNDRCLNNWELGDQAGPLSSPRLHHLADALAIVGFFPSPGDYSDTHVVLSNGTTKVGVGESTVKIANANTTLLTLLQQLITDIKGITTTNAVVGAPCLISPTSQAALAADAIALEGLLE